MLAALRGPNATEGGLSAARGRRKVIYLAPSRALVSEKAREWRERLGRIGITFAELTGDNDFGGDVWGEIENVDAILATPEKFDRVTRLDANRGGMSFFSDVAAVLIDEVHLIGDIRGGCLEAIVSRLKLLSKSSALLQSHLRNVRFGAVSATIPNIENLANWLGANRDGTFVFGEEFRPVKLQTYVRSFPDTTSDFLFNKYLKQKVFAVIREFYRGKQTLVFLGSRNDAQQTAKQLVVDSRRQFVNPQLSQFLLEASMQAQNKHLAECITAGVAFHHAGLERGDRELVEGLFCSRAIMVLCSTSTLAVGVNLPAYLCVVAGTDIYDGGGAYKEISMDTLLQMIGRAGRPQFDTEGVAVVMTKNSLRSRYEGLVHGKYPLESSLGSSLPEYLNAEISCRTVNTVDDVLEWVQSTYYYIRVCAEPRKYGIKNDDTVTEHVKRLIKATLDELIASGMCAVVGNNALQPLKAGDIMSLRYLRFKTMKNIMRNVATPSYADLLRMLCESYEFKDIKLRRDERKLLKQLNTDQKIIRFPVQETTGKSQKLSVAKVIRTPGEKLYLLAQYILTDVVEPSITLSHPSMRMEGDKVLQLGTRIMRAASEYYQSTLTFTAAANAFSLAKGLDVHMWPDTKVQIRQLKHSRMKKVIEKLIEARMMTLEDVEDADPRRIEMKLGKSFPFGNTLQGDVKDFPSELKVEMTHHAMSKESYSVDVKLSFKNTSESRLSTNHLPAKYPGMLFIGSEHDDRLLYVQRLPTREFDLDANMDASANIVFHGRFTCTNVPSGNVPLCFVARVIFERCIGRDVVEYHVVNRGGASPRTPDKSGVSPAKSPASTTPASTMKQTKIIADAHTKKFRLMNSDDEVRRKVAFEDFKLSNESSPNSSPRERKATSRSEDVCNRCGVKGHWAKDCLYPDNRPEELRPGPKPTDKCRRCGELGHFARDCSFDEDTCKICQQHGHRARDCPSVADVFASLDDTTTTVNDASDSDKEENWEFVFG